MCQLHALREWIGMCPPHGRMEGFRHDALSHLMCGGGGDDGGCNGGTIEHIDDVVGDAFRYVCA